MKNEFNAIYGFIARLESSKEKLDAFAAIREAEKKAEKAETKHIEKTRLLCSVCESKLCPGSNNELLE